MKGQQCQKPHKLDDSVQTTQGIQKLHKYPYPYISIFKQDILFKLYCDITGNSFVHVPKMKRDLDYLCSLCVCCIVHTPLSIYLVCIYGFWHCHPSMLIILGYIVDRTSIKAEGNIILLLYCIVGIFQGVKFLSSEFLVEKCSWSQYTKPHPCTTRYCFVGKHFVGRLSTTKTTKILPLKNYPLYCQLTLHVLSHARKHGNAVLKDSERTTSKGAGSWERCLLGGFTRNDL